MKLKTSKMTLKLKKKTKAPAEEPATDVKVELKQRTMFEEESRVREAADRIRRINRPYSISFGGLPEQRRVSDAVKGKMLEHIETDKDSVGSFKKLLAKHPLITKLSSAQGVVKSTWETLTYPYVIRGQRLFVFDDTKIDFENWNQEQIEQEMARQRGEFEAKLSAVIQEYLKVAKEVAAGWQEILAAAKDKLKELFDPRDYPNAEEVEKRLYVDFGPEGVLEASTESRYMSKELQGRDQQRMRDRFEAVVRLQEDVFITAFKKAIDQALKSITAADTSDKTFHKTVLDNLFGTFVDFRNKCLRYGMLTGTKVEATVQECVKALDADNMKVDDLAMFIRKSDSRRKDALDALNKAASAMAEVATERASSRVVFRREVEE